MNLPIVHLEVDSMRYEVLHAFADHQATGRFLATGYYAVKYWTCPRVIVKS